MDVVVASWPVVVPVLLVSLAAAARTLVRRGALSVPRAAVAVAACVYGAGLFRAVLLPFPVRVGAARDGTAPWHAYLQLVPFYDSDPAGYLLNVVLFVPLGLLLPLVARISTAGKVVAIAFVVSLIIELVQFVLVVTVTSGRVADVDDLLANTLGALLGFLSLRLRRLLPPLDRLAHAATWPPARPSA